MAQETEPNITPIVTPVTTQEIKAPVFQHDDIKDEKDTINALGKLFDTEDTPPPVTPVSPVVTPTPVGAVKDDFDTNLNKFDPQPGTHPNLSKGIDELKKISRQEHLAKVEFETKYNEALARASEFEKKIQEGVIPDNIKKELEETRAWRREVDLKNSPEFKQSYVTPVQEAGSDIMNLLNQAGLKEDSKKFIEENGGIIAMSQSLEPMNENQTLADWVNDTLLPKTPAVFRNRILTKLTHAADLMDQGNKELTDWQTNSKERWEARQNKMKESFTRGQQKALADLGDLAKPKSIPADATPEQRAEAEAHNSRLKTAETKLQEYLTRPSDPEAHGELLIKATQADALLAWNKELLGKLQAAEQRLTDIKAAGSHSQAGSHTPPPGPVTPTVQDMLKQSNDSKALGALLDQVGVTR